MKTPLGRAVPISNYDPKKDERIKVLENLLAVEIGRAAGLLKENQKLEMELETLKHRCNTWRRYYEKTKGKERIPHCDRSKAMVEYGEVDMEEVLGSK